MPPRPPLTHFLALPLHNTHSTAQLERTLSTFKSSILTRRDALGVPALEEGAFRGARTLHVTLGVMSLDDDSLVRAKRVLEDMSLPGMAGLKVDLKGIASMRGPEATSVLYIPPWDASGRLESLAHSVRRAFEQDNLVIAENRELRLHATVVNTIYAADRGAQRARGRGTSGRGRRAGGVKIDARALLEGFGDYVFCEDVPVDRVVIYRMGAVRGESGEAYIEAAGRTIA